MIKFENTPSCAAGVGLVGSTPWSCRLYIHKYVPRYFGFWQNPKPALPRQELKNRKMTADRIVGNSKNIRSMHIYAIKCYIFPNICDAATPHNYLRRRLVFFVWEMMLHKATVDLFFPLQSSNLFMPWPAKLELGKTRLNGKISSFEIK